MWDTPNQLFESKNENHKMALKDKLHNVKMNKDEGVASYLTHVAQVKDELAVVENNVPDSELARVSPRSGTYLWSAL